ncbi:YfiR family protein [Aestuariibacter halophilus]|uniref:YfiR family protein n=1 Tax=Fluctibacter halophilus TaxID=226011 RepID=A0ABS8GAS1_9ALTE|nr:YfiR family protein [Aestuariibacter halophilus]MCC2617660.1 YfiR family protein [Aestuariibacter halophilus]
MRCFVVLLSLMISLLPATSALADEDQRAREIRTTFLFHIANYTIFPSQEQENPHLTFCFLESAPYLYEQEFAKVGVRQLNGMPTQAFRLNSIEDAEARHCDVLLVDKSEESEQVYAALEALNRKLVTVGVTRRFTNQGGLVSLVEQQSKINVFIDRKQYRKSPLKFSSLLLRHAKFL